MTIKSTILTEQGFMNHDELSYPFEERGLQFGDGVYEVIRVYNGQYYLMSEHINRLYRSAAAIKLQVPFEKEELWRKLDELLEMNKVTGSAKLYLQITRGSAPRDHIFPVGVKSNMYAYVMDHERNIKALKEGIKTITVNDVRWENCYIKSLNLLPNVLAKQEAHENGCGEAILHRNGTVTECSSSNVYAIFDGQVYTHPASKNILHGCVRMKVQSICEEKGIPFVEKPFSIEEMWKADELFISSSLNEVTPVIEVDQKKIQEGKPGKMTQLLQKAYEEDAGISDNASIFQLN
ncbi:D-amino-acid transaminase [Bacillaceae bacterium S4-13-56]